MLRIGFIEFLECGELVTAFRAIDLSIAIWRDFGRTLFFYDLSNEILLKKWSQNWGDKIILIFVENV